MAEQADALAREDPSVQELLLELGVLERQEDGTLQVCNKQPEIPDAQDESGPPLADTESTPATLPEQHEAVASHESADQTCKSSDGNPHESQTGVGLGSSEILPDIEDSQPYPGPTQDFIILSDEEHEPGNNALAAELEALVQQIGETGAPVSAQTSPVLASLSRGPSVPLGQVASTQPSDHSVPSGQPPDGGAAAANSVHQEPEKLEGESLKAPVAETIPPASSDAQTLQHSTKDTLDEAGSKATPTSQNEHPQFPTVAPGPETAYITRRQQIANKNDVKQKRGKEANVEEGKDEEATGDVAAKDEEAKDEEKKPKRRKTAAKSKIAAPVKNPDQDVQGCQEPAPHPKDLQPKPKRAYKRKPKGEEPPAAADETANEVTDVATGKRKKRKQNEPAPSPPVAPSGSSQHVPDVEEAAPHPETKQPRAKAKAKAKAAGKGAGKGKSKKNAKPKGKAKAKAKGGRRTRGNNEEESGEVDAADAASAFARRSQETSEVVESLREKVALEVRDCLKLCEASGEFCVKGKHQHEMAQIDVGDGLQLSIYWSRNAVGLKDDHACRLLEQLKLMMGTSHCEGLQLFRNVSKSTDA